MVFIPHKATDEEILNIVRQWVDVLASEDYSKVFAELGYSMAPYFSCSGADAIRQEIKNYRSPEFYPNVTDFKVTDWQSAKGGNPKPNQFVIRYKSDGGHLAGAVGFDLPINGKWSDLQADFVFFNNENYRDGYVLGLEEIQSFGQRRRDDDQNQSNSIAKGN
jgi:hypothetical protein